MSLATRSQLRQLATFRPARRLSEPEGRPDAQAGKADLPYRSSAEFGVRHFGICVAHHFGRLLGTDDDHIH